MTNAELKFEILSVFPPNSELNTPNYFFLKKIFPYLGQGHFGHAIFDEAHGERPALLCQVRAVNMGQGNKGQVILFFLLG